MPALISCSLTPLPIETVPAIKIIHFNGSPKSDEVYAYARLYACCGALKFSFTRFEENPADTVRMALAITSADNMSSFLFFSLGFNGDNSLSLYNNGEIYQNYSPINLQISNGGDEQGLYYTAEGEIPADVIEKALGISLLPKTVLAGNVYSYDITESALGTAFKSPYLSKFPTNEGFEAITCVSY